MTEDEAKREIVKVSIEHAGKIFELIGKEISKGASLDELGKDKELYADLENELKEKMRAIAEKLDQ